MRKTLLVILLLLFGGCVHAQQIIPGLQSYGVRVVQGANGLNGGYVVFSPITYNPYDQASPCYDAWGNEVQQPLPTPGTPQFGANDLVLWASLSPSMPSIGCGAPLPVNITYGINTNGYLFGRGGLATDNSAYNSIQSLSGGVLGGSFTAGIYYPAGTITTTGPLGVGAYLGGHVDTGHSIGPPAAGSIAQVTNPLTTGEGLVAGMIYFDDSLGCERVYSGSSWTCVGTAGTAAGTNTDVQYNNNGSLGASPTFNFVSSTGVMSVPVTSINSSVFIGQTSAPSVSSAGDAVLYYNSTAAAFYASYSGGAYAPLLSGGSSVHALSFPFGTPNSGVSLTTSWVTGTLVVPFACTIGNPSGAKWSLTFGPGDSGTATVKFWKVGSGTAIPTSANSISTSGLSISTGTAVESSTFTDFTSTTITAGDIMIATITAITGTIDYIGVILPCQ